MRQRRSEKWRLYPSDVLPAHIAEMDYDLAEPVLAALRSAIDRSDCGYAIASGLGGAFARFAAARHEWAVDPGRVHLVPDVMMGVDAILALTTEPGDGVVINTPVYPPFFEHIPNAGRRVVEVPLVRGDGRWELDFDGLEAAFAAGARGYRGRGGGGGAPPPPPPPPRGGGWRGGAARGRGGGGGAGGGPPEV